MITATISALQKKLFQQELYKNTIDSLYFTENGMMGEDENNIVQIKTDLKKSQGDTITFGLTSKPNRSGGATGDEEIEGKEQAITAYSQAIAINLWRDGIALKGKFDEKTACYNMRKDASAKLKVLAQEWLETQFFLKAGGVTNTSLTDIYGENIGIQATFGNTPPIVPDADCNAGYGSRYLCADYKAGATSLSPTDIMSVKLVKRLALIANTAKPKMRPLRINGKSYFNLFIHPHQAYDLKEDDDYKKALENCAERGMNNPIFTGMLTVIDGIIIHEHPYVPFLDISAAGYNFAAADSGTQYSLDTYRAILCGQQAIGYAQCDTDLGWVEIDKDAGAKHAFYTAIMGGVQKIQFNSLDYSVCSLDTVSSISVA